MLDVFHVLFEEDAIPVYEQHRENKSRLREAMYSDLYGRPYKYAVSSGQSSEQSALGIDPELELPTEVTGTPREIKPYLPPTNIEDLPGILDAPLN